MPQRYPYSTTLNKVMSFLSSFRNASTIAFFISLSSLIFSIQAQALSVPELKGHVNDTANLLSSDTRQLLEKQLRQVAAQDSTQIMVLTITSLARENIEQYSLKVAEKWAIGHQQFDNGVLLLIAEKDRKIRIETGYGIEGVLTDLVAGRIIRNIIVPEFRKKRFNQGVINGVAAIIAIVKGEFDANALVDSPKSFDPNGWIIAALVGFFFIGIIFRRKQKIAAVAGGSYGLVLGLVAPFIQTIAMILLVAVVGMMSGAIVSTVIARRRSRRRNGAGKIFSGNTGDNNRSDFGTRGGGKSGRGGDFGGGGASGDW